MSGESVDEWWLRVPGIDPRDYEFCRDHANEPIPDIGVCFAYWNGEQLGPFSTRRQADAALNAKLAELAAQGIDLVAANPTMSVVFADPAMYHTSESTKPNA